MPPKDPINWMLSDAIETLARAERLRQQFLNLQPLAGPREPSWEPPIDVLETDRDILILIACRVSIRMTSKRCSTTERSWSAGAVCCLPNSEAPESSASSFPRDDSNGASRSPRAVTPSPVLPRTV